MYGPWCQDQVLFKFTSNLKDSIFLVLHTSYFLIRNIYMPSTQFWLITTLFRYKVLRSGLASLGGTLGICSLPKASQVAAEATPSATHTRNDLSWPFSWEDQWVFELWNAFPWRLICHRHWHSFGTKSKHIYLSLWGIEDHVQGLMQWF